MEKNVKNLDFVNKYPTIFLYITQTSTYGGNSIILGGENFEIDPIHP